LNSIMRLWSEFRKVGRLVEMRIAAPLLTCALALGIGGLAMGLDAPRPQSTVTLSGKGLDLRKCVADLFANTSKQFRLDQTVKGTVDLSVRNAEFDVALNLLCVFGKLSYRVVDGVYEFYRATPPVKPTEAKPPPTSVPSLPLDTSLGFSLDRVTKALKLTYRFTDRRSILVAKR
jgi:type II secretory pathway component GspD/PulD (secretin)